MRADRRDHDGAAAGLLVGAAVVGLYAASQLGGETIIPPPDPKKADGLGASLGELRCVADHIFSVR